MVFLQLKPEVRNFFAPYIHVVEDKILFPYTLENQVVTQEHWSENGVRIPVCKGMWLVTDSLPISVTNLLSVILQAIYYAFAIFTLIGLIHLV